jgi:formamidopyrimidine-DNA glycosylase
MPELPDLAVFAENLTKKLANKKLVKLKVVINKYLKTSEGKLKKALEDQKLIEVFREGKELRFLFQNGNVLGLHLMLHGNIEFFEKKNDQKHTVAELWFEDKTGIAITDWQKNARLSLNPEKKEAPDALSKKITFQFLKEKLSKSKALIKAFLTDQEIIRGIGNAYADEILHEAKISPFSISKEIPEDKMKLLVKTIRKVLVDAQKQIKKSHPGIISGEVRDFLKIHNAGKQKSPSGYPIQHKTIGSRKTYFTDEQVVYN